MARKHFMIVMLYFMLAFLVVPVAHAQADLEISDILNELGPRQGDELIWDIILYAMFFLGFLNVFLIPDKQLTASLLNFVVLGMILVSKLLVGDGRTIQPTDFAVLILNVGSFVIPLIIAGMLRSVKGKPPRARIPAGLMGLLGGTYFFLFWALEQRGA